MPLKQPCMLAAAASGLRTQRPWQAQGMSLAVQDACLPVHLLPAARVRPLEADQHQEGGEFPEQQGPAQDARGPGCPQADPSDGGPAQAAGPALASLLARAWADLHCLQNKSMLPSLAKRQSSLAASPRQSGASRVSCAHAHRSRLLTWLTCAAAKRQALRLTGPTGDARRAHPSKQQKGPAAVLPKQRTGAAAPSVKPSLAISTSEVLRPYLEPDAQVGCACSQHLPCSLQSRLHASGLCMCQAGPAVAPL